MDGGRLGEGAGQRVFGDGGGAEEVEEAAFEGTARGSRPRLGRRGGGRRTRGSARTAARASATSAASRTRVAPSRIRALHPPARPSSGLPGTAMTSRPWSRALRAVIRLPERSGALDDDDAEGEAGDDAVAAGEVLGAGRVAHRHLGEAEAAGGDLGGEGGVLGRVDVVDAAGVGGDGAGGERGAVGGGVDAAGEAGGDDEAGGAEVGGEARGHAAAEGRGVAGADEGDGRAGGEGGVAERPEQRRRVGDGGEQRRVVGGAEEQRAGAGGLAGLPLGLGLGAGAGGVAGDAGLGGERGRAARAAPAGFYSIRSERQLMERLEFDLLFRWFVRLGVDDPVWDASVFSKNRDRLLAGEVARRFLAELLARPEVKQLLSAEHFSVDGTLIQAWASQKSFRRKDGGDAPPGPGRNGARDFRGEKRSNTTHASTTDPDARLYRKGDGERAKLCYIGHALMENRNGLLVGGVATRATGDAEPLAAIGLVGAVAGRAADHPRGRQGLRHGGLRAEVPPGEGHAARGTEHLRHPRLAHRRSHHPASRLRSLPAPPQADRGGLRLGEGGGGARPGQAARPRPGRLRLRARPRRLQPRAAAEAAGRGLAVSAPVRCRLIGRWRIVAAERRKRSYPDLCGPAMLDIPRRGHLLRLEGRRRHAREPRFTVG